MFLSKLFGIFKKKKDNQPQDTNATKPAVSPPGTVGAAVGLSQPSQAVNPGVDKVAQASPEPDFPKPDVDAASDAINPEPTAITPSEDTAPLAPGLGEPETPAEEPPVAPEAPPAPPQETPVEPPASDDSQNIAV